LGIGDWGLGIGDLGVLGCGPNPKTKPPQPKNKTQKIKNIFFFLLFYIYNII